MNRLEWMAKEVAAIMKKHPRLDLMSAYALAENKWNLKSLVHREQEIEPVFISKNGGI